MFYALAKNYIFSKFIYLAFTFLLFKVPKKLFKKILQAYAKFKNKWKILWWKILKIINWLFMAISSEKIPKQRKTKIKNKVTIHVEHQNLNKSNNFLLKIIWWVIMGHWNLLCTNSI